MPAISDFQTALTTITTQLAQLQTLAPGVATELQARYAADGTMNAAYRALILCAEPGRVSPGGHTLSRRLHQLDEVVTILTKMSARW